MRKAGFGTGLDRSLPQPGPKGWRRAADALTLTLATLFLLAPMIAMLTQALPGLLDLPPQVWPALARSILVALASAALTMALALTLAMGAARGQGWLDLPATLPLATSGLVLGTGLFLLVQPLASSATLALPVTIMVNALLALPFVYRLLAPEARALHADYARLADSLSLIGLARLRLLILPRLARPLGFGTGLTAALSMGDLGVIALFAGEQQATLPLVIQRLTASYRTDAAASASLLLVAASFALFWIFDQRGRHAAS
jgi:thiamine transport system permease protein